MINILDKKTIDKIAAGEVVDRPSGVVKELCENSIDAGADSISIEIIDGGIKLIRITDNGAGIDACDVKTAFFRHSTSKIKEIHDLNFINTLGFRGEALSSISAVSKLEICTKTKDSLTGIIYKMNGGEEISYEEAGLPDGTTVIVRDIFYNTPARLKFLKSKKTEASYISDIIERLALSHPDISFKFISNNSIKLSTSGNSKLKDVIYSVYGKDIADKLIFIDSNDDLLSINGYIASPDISRGNRAYENYFINGRYVKDKIIEKAIEEAYKGYQMKGTFPFCVFDIKIEPELIDVNVHPSKMEVRFFDNDKIFDSVYTIINDAILKAQKIPVISLVKNKEPESDIKKDAIPEPFETVRRNVIKQENIFVHEESHYDNKDEENISDHDIKDTQNSLFNDEFLSKNARVSHKIIGCVFDTYWIIEYDGKIFIIDQHAAHEKVLYEKLKKTILENKNYSQQIFPNIIITLKPSQEEAYKKCIEQFSKLGFDIEPYGDKDYRISAVPMDLFGLNSKEQFMVLLDELTQTTMNVEPDILFDRVATASCKAAVKGGGRLSFSEANSLIDSLLKLDNPYNCPHGRPTIITISKSELERKFKRLI